MWWNYVEARYLSMTSTIYVPAKQKKATSAVMWISVKFHATLAAGLTTVVVRGGVKENLVQLK